MEERPKTDDATFPCKICGRHFIRSSLDKHEPACKKLAQAHRKMFDSGKQRAAGSDIPITDIRKVAKEKERLGGVFPRPKTQWRERHQEFIGAVQAGKQADRAIRTGVPLPPHTSAASTMASGYIRCDYCGRTFIERAAERHIPFCKEQHMRGGGTGKGRPTKTPASHQAKSGGQQATAQHRSLSRGRGSLGKQGKAVGGAPAYAEHNGNTASAMRELVRSRSQSRHSSASSKGASRPNPHHPTSFDNGINGQHVSPLAGAIGSMTIGGAAVGPLHTTETPAKHSVKTAKPLQAKSPASNAKRGSVGSRVSSGSSTSTSHLPQPAARRSSSRDRSHTLGTSAYSYPKPASKSAVAHTTAKSQQRHAAVASAQR